MILIADAPLQRVERIGLVVSLVLAALLMWPVRGYVTDDTFIHLQYARHLAQGHGLVFNVGEHVYGCTSPLWAILIADFMALGVDGLLAARLLGAVSTLASVALFLQLMRRTLRTPELRALATVTWAGHAWMLRWSLSGMETPLAVALTLAGFVAFTEGGQWGSRPVRTGALWSLAALTRPEAVFLLALWGMFLTVDADNRDGLRRLLLGLLPPALIYGAWLVQARIFFGTFWPETLTAKAAGGGGMALGLSNLWRQIKIVGATDGVLAALLVLGLVFGAPRRPTGRVIAQRLLPLTWLIGVPALYVARGVPVLSRYLVPMLPVLAWLAWRAAERWWIGREAVARPGETVAEVPADPGRVRRAVAMGAVVAALALAQNLGVYRGAVLPQVRSFSAGLKGSLVAWGRWIDRYTAHDAVIATPDIGAIGYFGRRRVLDLGGLITPRMIPLLERQPEEDVVAHLAFSSFARPEYVIDRAPVPNDLIRRSPHGHRFTPLQHAEVPNLGIARPGAVTYTLYRVDWTGFDYFRPPR